jgi:arsenate reductase (glutaredoxin)
MYTVYGIPNCGTVKKALTWLDARGVAYQFHDYKKKGISPQQLEAWLQQESWEKLVNRSGMTWRQLSDEEKQQVGTLEGVVGLMASKTSVIRRPLIEDEAGRIRALGFSEEAYEQAFGQ